MSFSFYTSLVIPLVIYLLFVFETLPNGYNIGAYVRNKIEND